MKRLLTKSILSTGLFLPIFLAASCNHKKVKIIEPWDKNDMQFSIEISPTQWPISNDELYILKNPVSKSRKYSYTFKNIEFRNNQIIVKYDVLDKNNVIIKSDFILSFNNVKEVNNSFNLTLEEFNNNLKVEWNFNDFEHFNIDNLKLLNNYSNYQIQNTKIYKSQELNKGYLYYDVLNHNDQSTWTNIYREFKFTADNSQYKLENDQKSQLFSLVDNSENKWNSENEFNIKKASLVKINNLSDGDTLYFDAKDYSGRLRFCGVDTPEKGYYISNSNNYEYSKGLEYDYAIEAFEYSLKRLKDNEVKNIWIEPQKTKTSNNSQYQFLDFYGRVVGRIFYEKNNKINDLGLELVRRGLARVAYISTNKNSAYYNEDTAYVQKLNEAQKLAQQEQIGVWEQGVDFYKIFPKSS